MSFYRKNPLFALSLTAAAVLVLAELALIYERYAESRAAAARYEQRKTDLQAMAELAPPPRREVATAIESDLAKARAALDAMQAELKGRGAAADRLRKAKTPSARTDAYFDLASWVEKTREAAAAAEVEVRPEAARLGFATYANEGPVQDLIEPVFRQRQIVQHLIDVLIEARPRAILAVKRERPLGKAEREARAAALANGEPPPESPSDSGEESPDYFVIDPGASARVPGYIDTSAFRFVFTGQTSALRTFLNTLAAFDLPVLVREVEIEPATVEESAEQSAAKDVPADSDPAAAASSIVLSLEKPAATPATKSPAAARAPTAVPIVSKPLSKFTVTVEFIELVPPATEAPAPAPAPAS